MFFCNNNDNNNNKENNKENNNFFERNKNLHCQTSQSNQSIPTPLEAELFHLGSVSFKQGL